MPDRHRIVDGVTSRPRRRRAGSSRARAATTARSPPWARSTVRRCNTTPLRRAAAPTTTHGRAPRPTAVVRRSRPAASATSLRDRVPCLHGRGVLAVLRRLLPRIHHVRLLPFLGGCSVREEADGKGPKPRAPRRRPTSLGERPGETEPAKPGHRAPGRLTIHGELLKLGHCDHELMIRAPQGT